MVPDALLDYTCGWGICSGGWLEGEGGERQRVESIMSTYHYIKQANSDVQGYCKLLRNQNYICNAWSEIISKDNQLEANGQHKYKYPPRLPA